MFRRRHKKREEEWVLQPQCRLLQLPGELRNRIYDLLLVPHTCERDPVTQKDQLPHRFEVKTLKMPALAATCRQIQHESLSYFFRYATFKYTICLDRHLHISHRLSRSTKRWLEATLASKLIVHDIVLSIECRDSTNSETARINFYHVVGSDYTKIVEVKKRKPHWCDALFKKLCIKYVKVGSENEWSVATIALQMAMWSWIPSWKMKLMAYRWANRAASLVGI